MSPERLTSRIDEDPPWEREHREWCLRTQPKQPLLKWQRGRTHKRKQRGTRKPWYRRGKWAQMKRYAPLVYEYLIGRVDESRVKR